MPRLPRVHLEGVLYLVTSRGDGQEPIFQDEADFEAYLGLVSEYKKRHGFKLFAYCLLPDHVHLCLELSAQSTVSAIMHDITVRYTKYYNKRYDRTGHLFQERFRAVLVEKEQYLLPLTAYLHRHPTRSGLTREFRTYPFSSYPLYGSASSLRPTLSMDSEIREALALLAPEQTQAAYQQYVSRFSDAEIARLRRMLQQRIVGSDEFVRMVREQLARSMRPAPSAVSQEAVEALPHRAPMPLFSGGLTAAVVVIGWLGLLLAQRVGSLEQMLLALSQENEAAFRARYSVAVYRSLSNQLGSLEGTSWELQLLMPIEVQAAQTATRHQVNAFLVEFTRTQVSLNTPVAPALMRSDYTLTSQANGTAVWDAVHTTPQGEIFQWRGEWHGTQMRGLLTHQPVGKVPTQVAFVGSLRKAVGTRSEI